MASSPPAREAVALANTDAPMRFVHVPRGSFAMGSPRSEHGRYDDEGPQHLARVAPFYIGVTPVTQAQWTLVMGTTPFSTDVGVGPDRPAQNISWQMAIEFCRRLTAQDWGTRRGEQDPRHAFSPYRGAPDHRPLYRLPTETQWEYAARAGTTTAYSFGDDAARLGEFAWYRDNSDNEVQPVATKRPNPWGLYDVHGNVWQWCWDWNGRYLDTETAEGWAGPAAGTGRVLRGGSFWSVPAGLRSAVRDWERPAERDESLGFRCVRSVGPDPSMR